MESIIVYRNPLEAMMWEKLMDGSFFPIIVGVVVFFMLFIFNNFLIDRFIGRWGKKAKIATNINLVISAIIAIILTFYMSV